MDTITSNTANPFYIESNTLEDYPSLTGHCQVFIPGKYNANKKNSSIALPILARNIYAKGWDMQTVADICEVGKSTIYQWMRTDPVFAQSMAQAKAAGNVIVGNVLWKKAVIEENLDAVKFYLTHRTEEYKEKREEPEKSVSEEALKLIVEILNNRGNLLPLKQEDIKSKDENVNS